MHRMILIVVLSAALTQAWGQTSYKIPPKDVVDILDAAPTPIVSVSPTREAIMLVEYEPHPPIALLARPYHRIAGIRVDSERNSRQRITQYTGVSIQWIAGGQSVRVNLPREARIGMPVWSHDGLKVAFARDLDDGVEVWVADTRTGKAKSIAGVRLNDVLGSPLEWMADQTHLLARTIPGRRGAAPPVPRVPDGPVIEETAGKQAGTWTYQDLLKNTYDEKLFEYYAMSQLVKINTNTGSVTRLGEPALVSSVSISPNQEFLLVTVLKRPFSYRVPSNLFARSVEVWDGAGKRVRTVASFGVSDEIPTQGVVTGPRSVQWQPLHGAKLIWVEALDGGDPRAKVSHRDQILTLASPFTGEPRVLFKLQHRYAGFDWTSTPDDVWVTEFDRDRRWRTTYAFNFHDVEKTKRIIFDLSTQDAYNHPGTPVGDRRADGTEIMLQDGDWVYLSGRGSTDEGDRPFLDRFNIKSLGKERLFRSDESSLEQFVSFVGTSRTRILTRHESKSEPPNYFVRDLPGLSRTSLTAFRDPAPQMTGMKKELVRYVRSDGVPLSGTLYLPPNYTEGERLPLLVWAYPLEYADAGMAGQVRGSPNSFTFFRGASPLFFVTQGYAVLMDATMPVVGDPETVNNTFVEQIVSSAQAAIDKMDELGVADRSRAFVSGHSYGAFMTANLLAHSDLFVTGIARSGAYNRTLTPFGFQSERRSFWEATETYLRVSPFTYAHRINEPILLIHGEADNNSGTYPIQSERMYQAIKGNGGTARLVMLPYESHGYAARESVLHVLAEQFEWADRYVKNRKVQVGEK
jgi:dipeptidyl aminopeptidase/acylaminoacyl peptidase